MVAAPMIAARFLGKVATPLFYTTFLHLEGDRNYALPRLSFLENSPFFRGETLYALEAIR